MTEEISNVVPDVTDSPSSSYVADPVSVETVSQQEKMIPQSEVNKIVGANKKAAYDKAKQDALAEFQKSHTNQPRQEHVSADHNNGKIDVRSEIDKYVQEIYAKEQADAAKAEDHRVMQSMQTKIQEASKKYADFDTVAGKNRYDQVPGLIKIIDKFDNASDIMYHLGENPEKFTSVAMNFLDPRLNATGHAALEKIANSLKNNEAAKQKGSARAPLSQIQPSNVGIDGGRSTKAALRSKWRV
jgi:hypothetical protein